MKSKNFTPQEVAHRPISDEVIEKIAFYVMGELQGFRRFCCLKLGMDIKIIPTSGNRDLESNKDISTALNPDNSYHIWRVDSEGYIIWAVDCYSPNIPLKALYKLAVEFFDGEVYMSKSRGIVHLSSYGKKEFWIEQ